MAAPIAMRRIRYRRRRFPGLATADRRGEVDIIREASTDATMLAVWEGGHDELDQKRANGGWNNQQTPGARLITRHQDASVNEPSE